jgi:hypothetical protein
LPNPRVYAAYPGIEPLLIALFDREEQPCVRSRRPPLRVLLRWGHDRRPGLANLDLDLLALSLLAIGEQAVRMILSDPDGFTSERYGRFARALLAVTSSQRSRSPCTSLSSEPASSACP